VADATIVEHELTLLFEVGWRLRSPTPHDEIQAFRKTGV
jgi:hypothetical protein